MNGGLTREHRVIREHRGTREHRGRQPQRHGDPETSTLSVSGSLWLILAVFSAFSAVSAAQSLSYTKGQNVAPAYEGWEQAPDGTKYFLFGYMKPRHRDTEL